MLPLSRRARGAALALASMTACAAPSRNPPRPPAAIARPAAAGAERREAGPGVLAANGFELPSRRPAQPHTGVEPLALPAALVTPIELTLTVTRSVGGSAHEREEVARGVDRVHVRNLDGGTEWLFIRNPLDQRRVSARRVEHGERVIIEYDESELAMSGIARGWADVACIGVNLDGLQRLSRTGKSESRFGFEFVEWRSSTGAVDAAIWWSDEAALPSLVAGVGHRQVVQVTSLRRGVERARLAEPRERFPGYRVLDVADYREKHHEG